MFRRRIRVDYVFRIDWPHGVYGYIPWTHRIRECGCTYNRGRSRKEVRVDLERTFKRSRQKARRKHRSQFEEFVDEFVDTVVHETHHAFEPFWTRWDKGERGARKFAVYATEVRK